MDGAHAAGAVDSVRFMFSPRKAVGGGGPAVKTPVAGTETKGTAAAALSSTAGVVRPMIAAQAKTAPAPSRQRKPEPPAQEDPADMAPPPAVDQSVNYMDMFSPVVAGGKVRNANAAASIIGAVPKIDFGVGGVKPKIAAVAKKEATVEAKKEANKEAVVNAKLKVPATPAHAVVTTAASANHDPLMDTFSPLVGGQRVDMAATTSVPVVAEMKPITCGESSEATAVEQAHVVEELVATPANEPVATPALDAAVDKLKESLVERLAEVPTAPMASSITAEQHGSTPVTLNSTPATPFNMSLLSSVLEEVLDTFRTDIRRDIHNMHLELLRQFEWQRTHLEESVRTVMLEFLQPAQQTGAMANGADDEDPFYMRYLSGGGGEDADEMFW